MSTVHLIGRVVFGLFFVYNAYKHFTRTAMMAGYTASKGVPMPKLAVAGTGFLLLAGGLSYVTGLYMFWGGLALVAFFLGVAPIMHAFWKVQDPGARAMETVQFTKDVALLAAVLMTM